MSRPNDRFIAALVFLVLLTGACKPSAQVAEPLAGPIAAPVAQAPAPEADAPGKSVDMPALPPEACEQNEDGARAFLNQFVRSPEIRKAYTATDYAKTNSDRFDIAQVDNRWVYADPTLDAVDYPRIEMKSTVRGDAFSVAYTKARFSNNDENVETYGATAEYTFTFTDGCWKLVAQTPMR